MDHLTLALELIKEFEGCKLSAYQDITGVWTIGWGHTGIDVRPGMLISQDDADALLYKDVKTTEHSVILLIHRVISENKLAALIDFAYNLGVHNLAGSTLLRLTNGDDRDASLEFMKWNHAGGKVVAGLTRRRQAEKDLFDRS